MEIVQERTMNRKSQMPSEVEVACEECSTLFKTERRFFSGRDFTNKICETCHQRWENERKIREAEEAQRRAEEARRKVFESEIPPLYRNTPKDRIEAGLLKSADDWEDSPKGLGMAGETGTGKTSAGARVLARKCKEGKVICFLHATELAELAASANQYEDEMQRARAKKRLNHAKRADITLLDDLGKGKLTERGESTLFEILEYRYSNQLPVFWTANSTAEEMLTKFSKDRGLAIIRRLQATSDIISQYKQS